MTKWDRGWLALDQKALDNWAGVEVVRQGSTFASGVREVCRTREGELVAWSGESQREATVVWLDNASPSSECTCGSEACARAVAVVLAFQQAKRAGANVPLVSQSDPRLQALDAAFSEVEEEVSVDSEEHVEISLEEIENYLMQLREADLRATLIQLVRMNQGVRGAFSGLLHVHRAELEEMITQARDVIQRVGGEAGLKEIGGGRSDACQRAHQVLEALSREGLFSEVLELGEALLEQFGEEELDERRREALERCLDVVAEAAYEELPSLVDRTVWAFGLLERPNASRSRALSALVEDAELTREEWGEVAELLEGRLSVPATKEARALRVDALVNALERSGRGEDVVPLLEAEADQRGSFAALITRLLQFERYEEAERWCRLGEARLSSEGRWGEVVEIHGLLRKSLEARHDWSGLAALSVEDYLSRGWEVTFEGVRRRCEKVGVWSKVRCWIIHYLSTGESPSPSFTVPCEGRRVAWPLPDVEVHVVEGERFPKTLWLIEIALKEHRVDDALALYEGLCRTQSSMKDAAIGARIADAISRRSPRRAISLWLERAEGLLEGDDRARVTGVRYLRKVMKAYARLGEKEAWLDLEKRLIHRYRHDRKRMQELKTLHVR